MTPVFGGEKDSWMPSLLSRLGGGSAAPAFPSTPTMFLRYEPTNPDNEFDTLDQAFVAADVNLGANKIGLPDVRLSAFSTYSAAKGVWVYFSSTGTLPAPLASNTSYYLSPASGGGYTVYPLAVDADWATQPGALDNTHENMLYAQNYSQGVNPITLTSQGSGNHRVFTRTIIKTLKNMVTGKDYGTSGNLVTDRATLFEVALDAAGKSYLPSRKFCKDNATGSYTLHGKTYPLLSTNSLAAKGEMAGKRTVWQVFIMKPVNSVNAFKSVVKTAATPASINTTTDVITLTAHRFNTKDLVNVLAYPSGTLPAPLEAGTDYFARAIDANSFTLHASRADANANTNIINLTSTGTVGWIFYSPERVGDSIRWGFPIEVVAVNGDGSNTLSPRTEQNGPSTNGIISNGQSQAVTFASGNITGLFKFPDLSQVRVWFPPRADRPTCADTGTALLDGTYWVTKELGSTTQGRLHRSLTLAQQSVGIASASLSNTQMIKYTVIPTAGEFYVHPNDTKSNIAFGKFTNNSTEIFETRIPTGKLTAFAFGVDYNNSSATNLLGYLGIDRAIDQVKDLSGTKAVLPAAAGSDRAWTLFNSAASHVGIDADIYAVCMGASSGGYPESEIQAIIDYYTQLFAILPSAPEITTAPTISGYMRVNQLLTATAGTVTGVTPTVSYQWRRNGTPIAGQTSLTYTTVVADQGATLDLLQTASNSGGSTSLASAATATILEAATLPVNATLPTVPASPQAGVSQTRTTGTWTGTAPITYVRNWQVETAAASNAYADISGAVNAIYTPVSADVGKKLRLRETATNEAGTVSAYSAASGNVAAAAAFESETDTLLARFTVQPSETRKNQINTLIAALKTAGVWSKLDALQVYAQDSTQGALLDWKTSSRTASTVNTLTFTTDRGYRSDGGNPTGGYIDTAYNSTTAGGGYVRDNAHIGTYVVSDYTGSVSTANAADCGVTRSYIVPQTGSGILQVLLNATTGLYTQSSITTAIGHHLACRASGSAIDVYYNGSARVTGHSQTSATPTNANMRVHGREGNTTFGTRQIAIWHAGSALNSTEAAAMNTAFQIYLTGIGAI
jgi:hypothetical protein